MLNSIRMDHLGYPARFFLAASTRAMLDIFQHEHLRYGRPGSDRKTVWKTLKVTLLAGLAKVASPARARLSYLESRLVRTALAAALKAAARHGEPSATLDLQRLKRALPTRVRTLLCQREHRAHVLLRLFVTGGDYLTTLVVQRTSGDAREAA